MIKWTDGCLNPRRLIVSSGFKPWERNPEVVMGSTGFTSAYPWYDICLGYSERDGWEDFGRWERRQRRFEHLHDTYGFNLSDGVIPISNTIVRTRRW